MSHLIGEKMHYGICRKRALILIEYEQTDRSLLMHDLVPLEHSPYKINTDKQHTFILKK